METNHAPGYQPGDHIIDRYIPNATSEQREEARTALLKHSLLLIRWGEFTGWVHADFLSEQQ